MSNEKQREGINILMASSRASQEKRKNYQEASENDEKNKRKEELEERIAEAKARRLLNDEELNGK